MCSPMIFTCHSKTIAPITKKMQDWNKVIRKERAEKKRVRFSPIACVEEIEPVAANNWYSRQDFVSFRASATKACVYHHRDSVSLSLKGLNVKELLSADEDDQNIRGLESIAIPQLGLKRQRRRQRVINSVLVAQATARDHQGQYEDLDVEKFIAFFAAKESKRSKELAVKMAKEDEIATIRAERQLLRTVNEQTVLHFPMR